MTEKDKRLPHDWQRQLNEATEKGREYGGLACCGTRGLEHFPYCPSGIPSNTMTIYAFFGLPEPPKEKASVPLVIYKDDGQRVVIGKATLNDDGTADMWIQDKGFLKNHFEAITDGLSIGVKLQEFSIAASIDSPPVVKWTLKDDLPAKNPENRG